MKKMKNNYEPYPECPQADCGDECRKTVKHYLDLNIPVDIVPAAKVGRIETECCGEPVVVCADGGKPDCCHLILVQKVCVKIPIRYTFKTDAGGCLVECCKGSEG